MTIDAHPLAFRPSATATVLGLSPLPPAPALAILSPPHSPRRRPRTPSPRWGPYRSARRLDFSAANGAPRDPNEETRLPTVDEEEEGTE